MTMRKGSILGGVITLPDVEAGLADYRDRLGLELVDDAALPRELAGSWGCPASAGARMATLRPRSGTHCFLRLVEQPRTAGFVPTTTYGWASYELTVDDVFAWPERLAGSAFEIVGPPQEIPGLPYFVAMQIVGAGGEMLYLNETRSDTPSSDLPKARSPVDHMFIAILAAKDRAASVAWYRDAIGLDEAETYVIPYSMINAAFGLANETTTALTMIQNGRMPIVEVDDYPPAATERSGEPGRLPAGNALVSLAVPSLDDCRCDWLSQPAQHAGAIYGGRRSATAIGAAGELVELVELVQVDC